MAPAGSIRSKVFTEERRLKVHQCPLPRSLLAQDPALSRLWRRFDPWSGNCPAGGADALTGAAKSRLRTPPAQSAAPELLPPEAAWPSARHHSSADGRVPTARVGLGTLRPELPVTLTCHKTFPGLPWFAPHEARSLAAGCTEPGAALAAAPQQPEGSPWQGDGAQLPARPGSTELAGEAAAAGWPRLRQCVRPRGPPPLLDCGVGRAPPGGPSGPRSQQRAQGDGSGVGSQAAATPGFACLVPCACLAPRQTCLPGEGHWSREAWGTEALSPGLERDHPPGF